MAKRTAKKTTKRKPIESYDQQDKKRANKPLREAIEFYKHAKGWTNRLIAGDSLLVMNSLLEKEGMAGKVQMIYIDPPYGIMWVNPSCTRRSNGLMASSVSPSDRPDTALLRTCSEAGINGNQINRSSALRNRDQL